MNGTRVIFFTALLAVFMFSSQVAIGANKYVEEYEVKKAVEDLENYEKMLRNEALRDAGKPYNPLWVRPRGSNTPSTHHEEEDLIDAGKPYKPFNPRPEETLSPVIRGFGSLLILGFIIYVGYLAFRKKKPIRPQLVGTFGTKTHPFCDEKDIEQEPDIAMAYKKRGKKLLKMKNYSGALGDFTRAIELDPKERMAYYYRSLVLEKLGQVADAIRDLEHFTLLAPNIPDAQNRLSSLRERQARSGFASDTQVQADALHKVALTKKLHKATELGFSASDATKECPACAETIKLKAAICRYCRREFAEEEREAEMEVELDRFLLMHKNDGEKE